MTPLWHEPFLRKVGRWGLILLTLFILFVISIFPFRIAQLGEIRPDFLLMAVYYWTIVRPSPPLAVFFVGLALDLMLDGPFGMNALVLVGAQWVTRGQRKFLLGQPFLVIWAGFALIALGAGAAQWAITAIFSASLPPVTSALAGVVLSSFLFPLMAGALGIVHKALAEDPDAVI